MIRLASIAAVLVAAGAPAAHARGLYSSEPPWHRLALADTSIALELGATAASGDTSAFLLDAALASIRRGPVRLAFAWHWVSVRQSTGRHFGFGDPLVFARLRLFGHPGGFGLHAEGMARIPIADPDLFPYASGGQEIEFSGTLGVDRRLLAGCGYIWSEPPSGGGIGAADVPHALHALLVAAHQFGDLGCRVRGDAYWMEGGRQSGRAEASVAWLAAGGLQPTLAAGFGIGGAHERVFDASIALRFAIRLH